MGKYICNISYKYEIDKSKKLLKNTLKILGFSPKFMDVFQDEFSTPLQDIAFDEEYLIKLLKTEPNSIIIKNQLYDKQSNESNKWFRLSNSVNTSFGIDTTFLEWSNDSLDFLFENNLINDFLESDLLISCYCYDQIDCMEQSTTFVITPEHSIDLLSDEKTVCLVDYSANDISINWGRFVSTKGLTLVAAPLMWFGPRFYKIIPEKKLLTFKNASLVKYESSQAVFISLFDLYDDPAKPQNRNAQKDFWNHFDLADVIMKHEISNPIDALAWLKQKAANKKKKI